MNIVTKPHPSVMVDLVDLGSMDERLSNVLAPAVREEAVGLTAQFTDNAEVYANAYASTPYFTSLIKRGVALAGMASEPRDILDVGAGAGDNSTFPAASMWPEARIVATDLSPQLLAILVKESAKHGISDRVSIVCVDAMKDIFQEESFDIVIGSAILHHLIEPLDALRMAHKVLRPGGIALFFEPFELGYALVSGIFSRIVTESELRTEKVDRTTLSFLKGFIIDVERRIGRDKSAPLYREIDDKWLFSKAYFTEAASTVGFSEVRIEGIHQPEKQLSNLIKTFLRIGAQTTIEALPDWARPYCENADSLFVESAKDIISEAIVVMKK